MKERKNTMNEANWYSPELLSQWFDTQTGAQFIDAELELLKRSLARIFGTHCAVSSVYAIESLVERIPCRRVYEMIYPSLQFSHHSTQGAQQVIAPIDCLPLPNDSIDAFVLLHTLDFVENPHDALREVARVIRPGGQMILIGFNPASLLGWSRYIPGLRGQSPSQARFLGRHRLCDWLNLLSFEVEYFGGATLVPFRASAPAPHHQTKQQMAQRSVWKAARVGLGKAFRERYGGIYCIRVRKTHMAGTMIGVAKQERRPLWNPMPSAVAVRASDKEP